MAAGNSRRFKLDNQGMHKLLYQPEGWAYPILSKTFRTASQVLHKDNICIVTNCNEVSVTQLALSLTANVLTIDTQGIGESIAKSITAHQHWDSAMILLADLPFINQKTVQSVYDLSAIHTIVRPMVNQQAGHPVGFQQCFFSQLMQLKGDQGANLITQHFPVHWIQSTDIGCIHDIDTLKDLDHHP